ncbi:MAG: TIGR03960 family B12-binding radical SAM protein [Armatimonadetes bacterium]|nr:TIGR03960 family B12-binding radical SAM protein [Armatimonadota bacterium]
MKDIFEAILPQVVKPARYLGNELNSVHKEILQETIRFLFVYPDLYEIGMSHLGSKILYELLNDQPDVYCERGFNPWTDMEEELRSRGIPILSLESRTPISDFHFIGFTLQYELSYSNILQFLALGGVPLTAAERSEGDPIILAGGPCSVNPEPLADFVDAFVLGEGEEVILEVLAEFRRWREGGGSRRELLVALSRLEGVYVPAFYQACYHSDGTIAELHPLVDGLQPVVQKRVIKNLNAVAYPRRPVVPFVEVVHDRLMVELFRGCTRACRFCQAGMIYRPVRERNVEGILSLIRESVKSTGYDEISLVSLSSADYTQVTEAVTRILEEFHHERLGISLPSTRLDAFSVELASLIKEGRSGLTLAPEGGTERLRRVINKAFSDEDFLRTVDLAFSNGWQSTKLYFLAGLPTEEQADLDGMVELLHEAARVARRASGKGQCRIRVSVGGFVPKPHTPYQWFAQNTVSQLRGKFAFLRSSLKTRQIAFSWHDPETSYMEGVFSRGDRRVGKALLAGHRLGSRFDGWQEMFSFSRWMEAFHEIGLDPDFYHREISEKEILPWDHISVGLDKDFLRAEWDQSMAEAFRPDCRVEKCYECGVCPDLKAGIRKAKPLQVKERRPVDEPGKTGRFLYRIKFEKGNPLRLLSHLDLLRALHRTLKRSGLPPSYTEGCNPHPRISLASALALGFASQGEIMDLELSLHFSPEEVSSHLQAALLEGLRVLEVEELPVNSPSAASLVCGASWRADFTDIETVEMENAVSALLRADSLIIQRDGKHGRRDKDIRPLIQDLRVETNPGGTHLQMLLGAGAAGAAHPQDILTLLACEGFGAAPKQVVRVGLTLNNGTRGEMCQN